MDILKKINWKIDDIESTFQICRNHGSNETIIQLYSESLNSTFFDYQTIKFQTYGDLCKVKGRFNSNNNGTSTLKEEEKEFEFSLTGSLFDLTHHVVERCNVAEMKDDQNCDFDALFTAFSLVDSFSVVTLRATIDSLKFNGNASGLLTLTFVLPTISVDVADKTDAAYSSFLVRANLQLKDIQPGWDILLDHILLLRANVELGTDLNRGIFINGWNAWSFSGTILQGASRPDYSMPDECARAFHEGSLSLIINQNGTSRPLDILRSKSIAHKRRELAVDPQLDFLASDMFTLLFDPRSSSSAFCGFLSQRGQFGCISTDVDYQGLSVHISCDGVSMTDRPNASLETDWLCVELSEPIAEDPFASYFETSGKYNRRKVHQQKLVKDDGSIQPAPLLEVRGASDAEVGFESALMSAPVGWCSWYHYFADISESILLANVERLTTIRREQGLHHPAHGFSLFQVDDGYQNAWGDWLSLDPKKFPNENASLKDLVHSIRQAGLRPGLWLAPFSADKHSDTAASHMHEWVLKREGSNSVPANSANCGKWFYGLDVTNPEFQQHLSNTIKTVVGELGFTYLKLDFLYVAALQAQESYYNKGITRAEAVQIGMCTITDACRVARRKADGEVFLLGCGAPLGSVIGHVHANRISSDAGLAWRPSFPLPDKDEWNLPSAHNMIRNTLNRMAMHKRWWINDPDCLLLRDTTAFTDEEIRGIATVKAFSGGSIIISDDLAAVPVKRLAVLKQILPSMDCSAVVLDLLERPMPELMRLEFAPNPSCELVGWSLLACCNWSSQAGDLKFVPSLKLALNSQLEDAYPLCCLVHKFEFWSSAYSFEVLDLPRGFVEPATPALFFPGARTHSAGVYALRLHVYPSKPVYLGSNIHISCGNEVSSFKFVTELDKRTLLVELQDWCDVSRDGFCDKFVVIFLPTYADQSLVNPSVDVEFKEPQSLELIEYLNVPSCDLYGAVCKVTFSGFTSTEKCRFSISW